MTCWAASPTLLLRVQPFQREGILSCMEKRTTRWEEKTSAASFFLSILNQSTIVVPPLLIFITDFYTWCTLNETVCFGHLWLDGRFQFKKVAIVEYVKFVQRVSGALIVCQDLWNSHGCALSLQNQCVITHRVICLTQVGKSFTVWLHGYVYALQT